MDIIYAIILATIIAVIGVIVAAYSTDGTKPSLGVAYSFMGGATRYWLLTLTSVATHATVYYYSPIWLTSIFISLALAGLGFNVYWARQLRKSQKRVAEIFAEAKADAARKAQLEQIAEKRAKLAEARSALEAGMPERATRLANEAR